MNKHRNYLSIAFALLTASSAFAVSPTYEISRAVTVAGALDIKQAASATFLQGFSAVIIRVKQAEMPVYVSAAIKMRPDFAPQITAAALTVRPLDRRNCEAIGAIIRAAITAAPTARYDIARAALAAQPASRECVLAAAGTSEADLTLAYARRSDGKDVGDSKDYKQVADDKQVVAVPVVFNGPDIWDVGNIISINPGPGGSNVVSPCDPND